MNSPHHSHSLRALWSSFLNAALPSSSSSSLLTLCCNNECSDSYKWPLEGTELRFIRFVFSLTIHLQAFQSWKTWKIHIWSTLSLPSLFFSCLSDSELCFPEAQNSVNNLNYVWERFYHWVMRKPFPALVLRSLFHCYNKLIFHACL